MNQDLQRAHQSKIEILINSQEVFTFTKPDNNQSPTENIHKEPSSMRIPTILSQDQNRSLNILQNPIQLGSSQNSQSPFSKRYSQSKDFKSITENSHKMPEISMISPQISCSKSVLLSPREKKPPNQKLIQNYQRKFINYFLYKSWNWRQKMGFTPNIEKYLKTNPEKPYISFCQQILQIKKDLLILHILKIFIVLFQILWSVARFITPKNIREYLNILEFIVISFFLIDFIFNLAEFHYSSNIGKKIKKKKFLIIVGIDCLILIFQKYISYYLDLSFNTLLIFSVYFIFMLNRFINMVIQKVYIQYSKERYILHISKLVFFQIIVLYILTIFNMLMSLNDDDYSFKQFIYYTYQICTLITLNSDYQNNYLNQQELIFYCFIKIYSYALLFYLLYEILLKNLIQTSQAKEIKYLDIFLKENKINRSLRNKIKKKYCKSQIQDEKEEFNSIINDKMDQKCQQMIKINQVSNFLRKCKLTKIFSEDLRKTISTKILIEYYKKDEVFEISQDSQNLYIIQQGIVQLLDKNDNILKLLSEGDSFGDLNFFIQFEGGFQIRCLQSCIIYKLDRNTFNNYLQHSQKDKDLFFSIKDSLLQNIKNCPQLNQLDLNCYYCNQTDHQFNLCPFNSYQPEIELLVKKDNFCKPNKRRYIGRRKKKINSKKTFLQLNKILEMLQQDLGLKLQVTQNSGTEQETSEVTEEQSEFTPIIPRSQLDYDLIQPEQVNQFNYLINFRSINLLNDQQFGSYMEEIRQPSDNYQSYSSSMKKSSSNNNNEKSLKEFNIKLKPTFEERSISQKSEDKLRKINTQNFGSESQSPENATKRMSEKSGSQDNCNEKRKSSQSQRWINNINLQKIQEENSIIQNHPASDLENTQNLQKSQEIQKQDDRYTQIYNFQQNTLKQDKKNSIQKKRRDSNLSTIHRRSSNFTDTNFRPSIFLGAEQRKSLFGNPHFDMIDISQYHEEIYFFQNFFEYDFDKMNDSILYLPQNHYRLVIASYNRSQTTKILKKRYKNESKYTFSIPAKIKIRLIYQLMKRNRQKQEEFYDLGQ